METKNLNENGPNMNRVLLREVAQAVKVPTILDSTEWGRECRQGAASEQVRCISALRGELSHVHDWKPSQHAYVPSVPFRDNHCSTGVLYTALPPFCVSSVGYG